MDKTVASYDHIANAFYNARNKNFWNKEIKELLLKQVL